MHPAIARVFVRRATPILPFWFVWAAILASVAGCSKDEPIQTYTIKKHSLIQIPVGPATENVATSEGEESRLLAAMVIDGKKAWYFKALAPISAFPDAVAEKFDQFLSTLKFENPDKPTWELGDGWTEKPGSGMRVANLFLGDLNFSVIPLGVPEGDERAYVVSNVNRWRREVSLPPTTSAELSNGSHIIKTADGNRATVVDFQGKASKSNRPMMAMGGGGPMTGAPKSGGSKSGGVMSGPPATSPRTRPAFEGEAPEHWKSIPSGQFTLAKYQVAEEERSAVISVSKAGGSFKMNVDRWRGQLGLPPTASESEIEAESVTVNGHSGRQVRLDGKKNGKDASIVVSMIEKGQSIWFFKLDGDTSLVDKETEAYDQFLSSVQLN